MQIFGRKMWALEFSYSGTFDNYVQYIKNGYVVRIQFTDALGGGGGILFQTEDLMGSVYKNISRTFSLLCAGTFVSTTKKASLQVYTINFIICKRNKITSFNYIHDCFIHEIKQ